MHAVVMEGGTLRFEERADPEPSDTEVLVEVEAAGLNGADLLQRRGSYPAPTGSPAQIPGLEFAGTVIALGGRVTRVALGDRVMALVGGGAQATRAVVDESHLLRVPDGIGWPEAGGFPEVFCTAYDALFTWCDLSVGDRLLVTGAAGGVGVAAVQLGATVGASVVASVRDHRKWEAVAALGGATVIGSDPDELAAAGPYDVVLEMVGAASLPAALGALATGARVHVIGVGSGARMEVDLHVLMSARARLGGSTLRVRNRAEKAAVISAVAQHVVPLLASGRISVPVCDTFPMAEAEAAYDRFAAGGKLGKVVLVATS